MKIIGVVKYFKSSDVWCLDWLDSSKKVIPSTHKLKPYFPTVEYNIDLETWEIGQILGGN